MLPPTITDYIGTLENPGGVFRTLGEVCVERDIYGGVRLRAGNSAAVFRYVAPGGERRLLKCYIRPNRHLRAIYEYVERRRPALLPHVRLLREEMFVHTSGGERWVDVVEGEWVEGNTLAAVVARATRTGDRKRLGELAGAFDVLWSRLAEAEWAHGDLKPENIIVTPGGTLTPIDCDAMWIPSLKGEMAAELGTPPYRHPSRTASDFDKSIDDHPARLISTALCTLASHPELWPEYTTFEDFILDNRRFSENGA